METKAVHLSVVILLISATSCANTTAQSPNNTNIFSNHSETFTTVMPTTGTPMELDHTGTPMELDHTDTALPSSTPLKVTYHISKLNQSTIPTTTKNITQTENKTPNTWLIVILVVIVTLMVVVGCVHTKRRELSSTASRLQTVWRLGVSRLENWLGVQLWSDRKTREEKDDDVEDEEGRHVEAGGLRMDEASDGSGDGKSKDDKYEHKKDDSKSSEDDDSIKEWVDLDKQMEAGRYRGNSMENKERATDGWEGAVQGGSGRDTSTDPEEGAQVSNTDLFDVTVF